MDKQPNENEKNSLWQNVKFFKNIFFVVAGAILLCFFLFNLNTITTAAGRYIGYIMPMIYGVCIAYIINPIMVFFREKFFKLFTNSKKERLNKKAKAYSKRISIALAILISLSLIIILGFLIIPELIKSLVKLGESLPGMLETVIEWFESLISTETEWHSSLQTFLDNTYNAILSWVNDNMMPTLESALSYITTGVISVFSFVFNFFVGIVVAVYTLSDKEKFIGMIKKVLYSLLKPKTANKIIHTARHGHQIFGGFLSGKIIDSLIVGIICFIFNIIAGMPYALLISVIVGVTNIIPFFGPFIGGIPSALLVFIISPMKGIVFAIFIIILQQIDGNIIGPKILGTTTGISEFWVTFSLLLFGGMFGFVGMIIGVPLFAVIYYLLKNYFNSKAEKKKMVTATSFYLDVDHYDPDTGQFIMIDQNALKLIKQDRKAKKSTKRKNIYKKIKNIVSKKNKKG